MKSIIFTLCACLFLAQGYAHADEQECAELRVALKQYEIAKEAWLEASADARSVNSTKFDAYPIVKQLAARREELREEKAVQALMNLKGTLSSMEIAKDWKIPNFKGVGNFRNMVLFSLATDVVCLGG